LPRLEVIIFGIDPEPGVDLRSLFHFH